jgi:hypothetical protein
MVKITKRLVVAFAVAGLIGWLWSWHLWNVYYDDGFHRHPDQVAGRVYVENMHGVPLYVTRRERFLLHGVSDLSIGLFAVACLIHWMQRRAEGRRIEQRRHGCSQL